MSTWPIEATVRYAEKKCTTDSFWRYGDSLRKFSSCKAIEETSLLQNGMDYVQWATKLLPFTWWEQMSSSFCRIKSTSQVVILMIKRNNNNITEIVKVKGIRWKERKNEEERKIWHHLEKIVHAPKQHTHTTNKTMADKDNMTRQKSVLIRNTIGCCCCCYLPPSKSRAKEKSLKSTSPNALPLSQTITWLLNFSGLVLSFVIFFFSPTKYTLFIRFFATSILSSPWMACVAINSITKHQAGEGDWACRASSKENRRNGKEKKWTKSR